MLSVRLVNLRYGGQSPDERLGVQMALRLLGANTVSEGEGRFKCLTAFPSLVNLSRKPAMGNRCPQHSLCGKRSIVSEAQHHVFRSPSGRPFRSKMDLNSLPVSSSGDDGVRQS